jgi:hypothetical protein
MFAKIIGVTFQITVILIFGINLAFILPLIKFLSFTHLSFQNPSETSETEYERIASWRHQSFCNFPLVFLTPWKHRTSNCQCQNALHEIGNKYQSFVSTLFVFGSTASSGPGPPHSRGF